MSYSNWLTDSITTDAAAPIVPELTNPQNTPEPDGATLTIESNSDLGTLYSYSKTTPFGADEAANAAEIMANGVGQAPVVGTNTRVVTGQDSLTPHYAGWVQDTDGYGTDLAMEFHIATDAETLTIPCRDVGFYDAVVDWGDGTPTSQIDTFDDAALAHEYELSGDYVVRISGVFPGLRFFNDQPNAAKLRKLLNLGDVGWLNCASSFGYCINATEITIGVTDTSASESYGSMFYRLNSLVDGADLRGLDLSGVSSTGHINQMMGYWGATTSPPNVSGWDMTGIVSLNDAFRNMSQSVAVGGFDIALDTWQIPKVTLFNTMLFGSKLTTDCYDRTLASWGSQALAPGAASTTIHFGTSQYTDAASHALLLAQVTNIIDGGLAP